MATQVSHNKPVSGILLAGGRSSRMGQDKAQLVMPDPVGKYALLDYMVQLMTDAGIDDLHISRNCAPYIGDNFPARGPLAGIEAGLHYCQHPHVLVVPVDMPSLTIEALHRLIQDDSEAACLQGTALPCKLPVNTALLQQLRSWLSATDENCSVQRLLKTLRATELPYHEQAHLMNTNTPQDWRDYEQSI